MVYSDWSKVIRAFRTRLKRNDSNVIVCPIERLLIAGFLHVFLLFTA